MPANASGEMPKSAAVLSDQTTRPVARAVSAIPMRAAASAKSMRSWIRVRCGDLVLEPRHVLCVLIGHARLPREGNGHPFVSLGEVVGAQLVCEAQPCIHPGRRGNGHAKVRRPLGCVCRASGGVCDAVHVAPANRHPSLEHLRQDVRSGDPVADVRQPTGVDAARHHVPHACPIVAQRAPRTTYLASVTLACRRTDLLEHRTWIAFAVRSGGRCR